MTAAGSSVTRPSKAGRVPTGSACEADSACAGVAALHAVCSSHARPEQPWFWLPAIAAWAMSPRQRAARAATTMATTVFTNPARRTAVDMSLS